MPNSNPRSSTDIALAAAPTGQVVTRDPSGIALVTDTLVIPMVHRGTASITRTISTVSLTARVATFTTTAPHGFAVGWTARVAGLTNKNTGTNTYATNGTWIVASVPTATTFTAAVPEANVSVTSDTGTVVGAPDTMAYRDSADADVVKLSPLATTHLKPVIHREQIDIRAPGNYAIRIFGSDYEWPYNLGAFFGARGNYSSGAEALWSQKRNLDGTNQGIAGDANAIGISPDVDGPGIQIESNSANNATDNSFTIKLYDLAGGPDPAFPAGPYSPGSGYCRMALGCDGTHIWGDALGVTPFANRKARQYRSPLTGHLTFEGNPTGNLGIIDFIRSGAAGTGVTALGIGRNTDGSADLTIQALSSASFAPTTSFRINTPEGEAEAMALANRLFQTVNRPVVKLPQLFVNSQDAVRTIVLGVIPGQESLPGMWLGIDPTAQALTNYSLLQSGTKLIAGAPAGGSFSFRLANSEIAGLSTAGDFNCSGGIAANNTILSNLVTGGFVRLGWSGTPGEEFYTGLWFTGTPTLANFTMLALPGETLFNVDGSSGPGTLEFRVSNSNVVSFGSQGMAVGIAGGVAPTSYQRFFIQIDSANKVGRVVRAQSGQVAPLDEWQDIDGNVLGSVSATAIASFAGIDYRPAKIRTALDNGGARLRTLMADLYYLQTTTNFQVSNGFALAMWVKVDPAQSGTLDIAAAWSNGSNDIFRVGAVMNTGDTTSNGWTGTLIFSLVHDGATTTSVTNTGFTAGVWHLIVAKYNHGTGIMGLSLDGAASTTAASITTPATGTGPIFFGGSGGGGGILNPTNMSLDSMLWYSGTPPSDALISTLWNNGIGHTYASLPAALHTNLQNAWDFAPNGANPSFAVGTNSFGGVNLSISGAPQAVRGAAGVRLISGTSPTGDAYEIQVPLGSSGPSPLVIYFHGFGEDQTYYRTDVAHKAGTLAALLASGYIVASGNFGTTINWGNPTSVDHASELYEAVSTLYPVERTVFWCQSMGGTTSLNTLYARRIPNVRGWFGSCPVTSLAALQANGFDAAMQIVYGYTGVGASTYAHATVGSDPQLKPGGWPAVRFLHFVGVLDNVAAPADNSVPFVAMLAKMSAVERTGIAQAGAATTITLDSGASAVNGYYVGCEVNITGGTGIGQVRTITGYVGATKVATVATWTTNPDNTSTFRVLPLGPVLAENTIVECPGVHGDPGQYRPDDAVAFCDRCTDAVDKVAPNLSYDSAHGRLGVGIVAPLATIHAVSSAANEIGMIVQGAPLQVNPLQEWRTSDGAVKGSVAFDGLMFGINQDLCPVFIGGLIADPNDYGGIWVGHVTPSFANYSFLGGPNQTLFNVDASGGLSNIEFRTGNQAKLTIGIQGVAVGLAANTTTTSYQQFAVIVDTNSKVGQVIQGQPTQAANLSEWNLGGSALSAVKKDCSLGPAHLADSAATNDSVYYSTTQSKLVYKDGAGVANPLY